MNELILLQDLWAARPGLHATTGEVAAWYRAKADVHSELAQHSHRIEDQAVELAHAERALAHANTLVGATAAPVATVAGGAAA